jgi:hypothetical protein
MKKVIFIADYFVDQIVGGGEKCNDALMEKLRDSLQVEKINSRNVNIEFLNNNADSFFIICNFIELNPLCIQHLIDSGFTYLIYEHDHKYVVTRNPALYKDFIIPAKDIVNYSFYKNAKLTICQTEFHANIVKQNLKFDNIVSSNTNFWSEEEQLILANWSNQEKRDLAFILDSDIGHKNKLGSIQYCVNNKLDYFLYTNNNFSDFVKNISVADKYVFFPRTPETFGRIAVECKILNMKIHTNGLLGVSYESWFKNNSGLDLLNQIKESNDKFLIFLKGLINE